MRLMNAVRESMTEGLITPEEYASLAGALMRTIDAPDIPPRQPTRPRSATQQWLRALNELQPGKVLLVDGWREQKQICQTAKRYGISITTRKLNGQGIAVWKT